MRTLPIILFVLVSHAARSQDSLSFYLAMAAQNNPTVLQKFNAYQAALQKVPQAQSIPDPQLSMGVFLNPMELVNGNQVADLRLMQMFPWFGTLRAARDEMSLMANAGYESFREAKLQVFFDVQQTWYELFKVKQNIIISEKNTRILRTIERLTLIKYQGSFPGNSNTSIAASNIPAKVSMSDQGISAGMNEMAGNTGINIAGTLQNKTSQGMQGGAMGDANSNKSLTDLYQLQIEIGTLENNTELLKNRENTLIALFNSYLNRPPMTPVAVPDSLPVKPLEVTLETASDSMLANSPMMGMLQFEQQSIDSRKKMLTRMGYPMIGVGVNYSLINNNEMSVSDMNGKDMVMPMIALTLPIYRKKYRAMQAEADFLKAAAAQKYTASANNLKTSYYEAIQRYQDARRRVTLYTHQAMLAGKSLEIMIQGFAASGGGLPEVLRVQQQALDFEYKKAEAIADYQTAIALLNRLMALHQHQ